MIPHTKNLFLLVAILFMSSEFLPSTRAAIIIDPTFGSSITTNANASEIEAGIDAAIARIESAIENPITVDITFTNMTTGLGDSSSMVTTISYSSYLTDLKTKQVLSVNDSNAIASLPSTRTNPVNGDRNITITTALDKAFGASFIGSDGSIGLNLSLMNLSRTGSQNPADYDLQAIAAHEIDEVLGIGGSGSSLPTTNSSIAPLDLFRYSASGVRSFTTSSSASAYFSINGGTNDLVNFNQTAGADYGDWVTGATPQVQDAFGTPGVDINIGSNELTALDIVGYNVNYVPEPRDYVLLVMGLGVIGMVTATRQQSPTKILSELRSEHPG